MQKYIKEAGKTFIRDYPLRFRDWPPCANVSIQGSSNINEILPMTIKETGPIEYKKNKPNT